MLEPTDVRRYTRELGAMIARADDPEGFAQVVMLIEQCEDALRDKAQQLNAEGYSAAALADALGVSRQAAHKRFLAEGRPGRYWARG